MSGTKSSSTRLPPRVASVKRRPSKRLSKAARRKMVERENAEREEINANIESCIARLMEVLSKGGVTDADLKRIREEFAVEEEDDVKASLLRADGAVDKSWSYASCYPAISLDDLVTVLHELRSLLCQSAALAYRPAQRRLDNVRSNSKADPNDVEMAEEGAKQIGEVVTKCNIASYKTRALHKIVSGLNANNTAEDPTT